MNAVKAIKYSLVFYLLFIDCRTLLKSQNTWIRADQNPVFEVSDVIIDNNNELYFSSKNTHHIYKSIDGGAIWNEIRLYNSDKFNHRIKKYFKIVGNQFFCGWCDVQCQRFLFEKQEFLKMSGWSMDFPNIKVDNDNQIFIVTEAGIAKADSDWMFDIDNTIIEFPDFSMWSGFLYSQDNNYAVSRKLPDTSSIIIYKLNTGNKDSKIYSSFKANIGPQDIFISSGGNIYYRTVKQGNQILYFSNRNNPNFYSECLIDSTVQIKRIYKYFINPVNQIFITTDQGVYMNEGGINNTWIKCYKLSKNFPVREFPSNITEYDRTYYIKDSLNAMISHGDNCGQAVVFYFTAKYQYWRELILDINRDNFINVKQDKNGSLYAFRPCENIGRYRYLESHNNGKDWDYLNFSSVGINKDGKAIGQLNNIIYINNSELDRWESVNTPISELKNIQFLHFYSNKNELFLGAVSTANIYPRKYYLFHSADGGMVWREIKSFITSGHEPNLDFEILVDNNNHWLVYSDQLSFLPYSSILISKDQGMSWQEDPRFKNFEFVSDIKQLPDNRYIISGRNPMKKYGTFITNTSGGFDLLADYFDGYPSKIYLQSGSNIFGYNAWPNGSPIPFTTKDIGKTVFEDESGLLPEDLDYRYIQSAILNPEQKTTLNLAYDGIYTSRGDVFSGVTNHHPKILKNYIFYQNFNTIILNKIGGNEFIQDDIFNIYNNAGQQITTDKLAKTNGLIDISNFLPGIYFLEIRSTQGTIDNIKFVK